MTPEPCPPPWNPRGSPGPSGPRNFGPDGPFGPKGPFGPPKNSSMRSRISSRPGRPEIFSPMTVVMLTTAGVTALATSVNPLAGSVPTGPVTVGVAAGEPDAGNGTND